MTPRRDRADTLFGSSAPLSLEPRSTWACGAVLAANVKVLAGIAQLRADRNTRYERIAEIMSASHAAGLLKLGLVTAPADPERERNH